MVGVVGVGSVEAQEVAQVLYDLCNSQSGEMNRIKHKNGYIHTYVLVLD